MKKTMMTADVVMRLFVRDQLWIVARARRRMRMSEMYSMPI